LYVGQADRTYLVRYSEQFYETEDKLLLLQVGLSNMRLELKLNQVINAGNKRYKEPALMESL
jgi:hypothetical protein